ncbi:VanZ family protein [Domibacillus sp. 8LH]|uniref:VanZ family protein n=1 Tax=Domibacillus sp. 8LH TaxID=3073900 RepID=UPI003180126E
MGNVLLFVPFVFLLPGSFRRFQRIMLTTGAAAMFSLFYEVIQLLFEFGSFDVDDLLLNTLGGFIGYMLFAAF